MKFKSILLLIFLFEIASGQNIKYNILKVEKPPVIDGAMDAIWDYVPVISEILSIKEKTFEKDPDNFMDCSPSFRLLWDEEYLYVYMETYDDIIHKDSIGLGIEKSIGYNDDCFEVFIDGNYSRGATWDNLDDCELWFLWNEPRVLTYMASLMPIETKNIVFSQKEWIDSLKNIIGWGLEVRFPLKDINVSNLPGTIFGLDLKYGDDDGHEVNSKLAGTDREHNLRWCANYDNHPPSTWFSVQLSETVAKEQVSVKKISQLPTIDGISDKIWDSAFYYSLNKYISPEKFKGYSDVSSGFKLLHNNKKLFFFIDIIDNNLSSTENLSDAIQIFIDGDAVTGAAYDNNTGDFAINYIGGANIISNKVIVGENSMLKFPNIETKGISTSKGFSIEGSILISDFLKSTGLFSIEVRYRDLDAGSLNEKYVCFRDSANISSINPSVYSKAFLENINISEIVSSTGNKTITSTRIFPNPIANDAYLTFSTKEPSIMQLVIVNQLGQEAYRLDNFDSKMGEQTIPLNFESLSSGVYYYRLSDNKHEQVGNFLKL